MVVEGFLVAKGGCLFLLMCFSQSAQPFLLHRSALSRINLRPAFCPHHFAFVSSDVTRIKLNLSVTESKHLLGDSATQLSSDIKVSQKLQ